MSDATCPSTSCEPGALLLGIRGTDGRIGYLTTPLPVSERFVERAHAGGRDPGRTLRFAGSCATTGCGRWDGASGRCGVADEVADARPPRAVPDRLPACGIRATCRWHAQRGPTVCLRCPVVTRTPVTPGERTPS